MGSADALNGTRQLAQILSTEGLARIGEDGRPIPGLAAGWTTAADGLSLTIHLRSGVKFHDGSPAHAAAVAQALAGVLPGYMGPAFADVERITPIAVDQIEIGFRRPSPFLLEALDAPIHKPGSSNIGTGPYTVAGEVAPDELRSHADYYLGPPPIVRIIVKPYPNVRSAWADLLRDRVDMLYEVGVDALDSLSNARNVSLFTYVRRYQYAVVFNVQADALRSREVRQALNEGVDLAALIRDALNGRAIPSDGPIWPQHWALVSGLPKFSFNVRHASAALSAYSGGRPVSFNCLVSPGLERIALGLKRQLEAIGLEMSLQEAPFGSILQAMSNREFDAVLLELISGPSLFRPYAVWHSGGLANPGGLGSPQLDKALDRVRYATNDEEYRAAVAGLQRTIVEDPPGIFLAWSERARAVSNRFIVPVEPGRDVLTTLRLWRPADAEALASRN